MIQSLEVIIDGIIALLIGGVLSVGLIVLFNLYFSNTIGVVLEFSAVKIIIVAIIVLIYIIVLSLIVSLIDFIKFKKNSLSEILQ
ncbi:MAG: hypothetical protein PUG48_04315 [Clostridia bacterium]|nr:hypothetical protein [Clostridia bacterium]